MQYKGWRGKIVGNEQHYRKGDYHLLISFTGKSSKAKLFKKGHERAIAQKTMPQNVTMIDAIGWAQEQMPSKNPGKAKKAAKVHVTNPLEHVRKGMSDAQQRKIVSRNIAREMEAGKPQRQAVAIALSQRRKDLGLPPRKNPGKKGLLIKEVSHLDHGLSDEAIKYIQKKYKDCDGFFIESFRLPQKYGMLECGLYGPVMGDAAIKESQVKYVTRGNRKWPSRMIKKPMRKTSMVTVIAGPHEDDACVLYTAYGGPSAPREPGDPSVQKDQALLEESERFWSKHALAMPQSKNPKTFDPKVSGGLSAKDVRTPFTALLPESLQAVEGADEKAFFAIAGGSLEPISDIRVSRGDFVVPARFLAPKYGPIETQGVDFSGDGRMVILGKVLQGPSQGRVVKMLIEKLQPMPSEEIFWHGPPAARMRTLPKTRAVQKSGSEIIAGMYRAGGMSREEAARAAGLTTSKKKAGEVPASVARQMAAARGERGAASRGVPASVARQVAASRGKRGAVRARGKGKPGIHEAEAMKIDLEELNYKMDNMSDDRLIEFVADLAEKYVVSEDAKTLTQDFGKEGRKKWSAALKMGRRKLRNRNLGTIEFDEETRARAMYDKNIPIEDIAQKLQMKQKEVRELLGLI